MTLAQRYAVTVELTMATGGAITLQSLPSSVAAELAPFYVGPPGPAGLGFDYVQASPAQTWTIAHNLGTRPSVATYTVGGLSMQGTTVHLSLQVLQINFSTPVAGYARLN